MTDVEDSDGAGSRRPGKSEAAFRTISEVSEDLDVPQHVLRFWESKFSQIKPLKRGGGRRYYRPEDLLLLKRIRDLLYKDGYTIRGVQKLLREQSRSHAAAEKPPVDGGGTAAASPSLFAGDSADEAEAVPFDPVTGDTAGEAGPPDFGADPAVADDDDLTPASVLPDLTPPDTEAPPVETVRTELERIVVELEDLRSLLTSALRS